MARLDLDEHVFLLNVERASQGRSALTVESLKSNLDDFYGHVKAQLLRDKEACVRVADLYPLFVGHGGTYSNRAANLALAYARQRLLADPELSEVIDTVHVGRHLLVIYPGWNADEEKAESDAIERIIKRINTAPPLASCVELCEGEDIPFLREQPYIQGQTGRKLYLHAGHVVWDTPVAAPPASSLQWQSL
jgi:hypothetical protein